MRLYIKNIAEIFKQLVDNSSTLFSEYSAYQRGDYIYINQISPIGIRRISVLADCFYFLVDEAESEEQVNSYNSYADARKYIDKCYKENVESIKAAKNTRMWNKYVDFYDEYYVICIILK